MLTCCCKSSGENPSVQFASSGLEEAVSTDVPRTTLQPEPVLMNSAEKREKKERLQELTKNFAQQAMLGVPCTYVDSNTGIRHDATYQVSNPLDLLQVSSSASSQFAKVGCRVAEIKAIEVYHADQQQVFPGPVLKSLQDDEQNRLLMVVHSEGSFCFLEASSEARSDFLTCMHVLRLFRKGQPCPEMVQSVL